MKKAFRIYNDVLTCIAVVGLVGFLACVTLQVFARVFLPKSPNWTEELARFLFIFMVAFAGNAAVSRDEYVGVELLTERFPAPVQKAVKVAVLAAIAVFSAVLFFLAVIGPQGLLAMTPQTMVSTALLLPMNRVYLSLAILFGLYMVSFVMRIVCVLLEIDLYDRRPEGAEAAGKNAAGITAAGKNAVGKTTAEIAEAGKNAAETDAAGKTAEGGRREGGTPV